MLYNKDFLLKLDKSQNKILYARITSLQFNESPIETIEGRITQGSINIDGSSAVRRSCSLSLITQDYNYNNYNWSLNTKFKLEIGLQNLVDSNYPSIIWFNQGIFIITNFNTSHSTNSFNISISGKDKMCLLNGEVSGSFESSIDFGTIEEETSEGIWQIRKIPIQEIIRNMVHTYAGEPYWNIIINDLDTYGLELLEYRYDTPMYLYRPIDSWIYTNIILENETSIYYIKEGNSYIPKKLKELDTSHLDLLVDTLTGSTNPDYVYAYDDGEYVPYIFAKVVYGQTAGYRVTDLVYAGDLIAKVGENIVTILDKIKNMLVEFEYFYDLDGRFVFQKKRSFAYSLWSPIGQDASGNPAVLENLMLASATAYTFNNGELITSFNNNPNISNLRNDYSIWGARKGIDKDNPIHLRYAIDIKPSAYTQILIEENNEAIDDYNRKYGTNLPYQPNPITFTTQDYDWREIIYQMALDYFKYNHLDDFELRLAKANPQYYNGQTGYENYYTDLQGFWRQLYCPNPSEEDVSKFYAVNDGDKKYWSKAVFESPETLNFWFDFLDTSGSLSQYNVKNIGSRSKSLNDTNVTSIYFRETPSVIFTENIVNEDQISSYKYIQIPSENINIMFSISAQGKSAKQKLDELIYQHGYCTETVSITAIPVYYLEPNTRILLFDQKTNLNGEYIINKISLSLNYNGTMNISAIKVAEDWRG